MRWFARRLGFYVFAIWVALTINFLLPRLMPGDPIAGLLQHLTPAQIQANPGIVQELADDATNAAVETEMAAQPGGCGQFGSWLPSSTRRIKRRRMAT